MLKTLAQLEALLSWASDLKIPEGFFFFFVQTLCYLRTPAGGEPSAPQSASPDLSLQPTLLTPPPQCTTERRFFNYVDLSASTPGVFNLASTGGSLLTLLGARLNGILMMSLILSGNVQSYSGQLSLFGVYRSITIS